MPIQHSDMFFNICHTEHLRYVSSYLSGGYGTIVIQTFLFSENVSRENEMFFNIRQTEHLYVVVRIIIFIG